MPETRTFWSALDAVVVINLDHRADRFAQIQSHLAGIVPPGKLHRLSAVRGVDLPGYGQGRFFARTKRPATWGGRAGCTLSHRNVMRLALEKGWQRTLVLEDDARFTVPLGTLPADELAAALGAFLLDPARAPGVCFLGFTEPRQPVAALGPLPGGRALYTLGGCHTTHAYVVDQAVCAPLLAQWPADDAGIWDWLACHNAIDVWYARHLGRFAAVTAVSPALVEQEDSFSDIVNRQTGGKVGAEGDLLLSMKREGLALALARLAAGLKLAACAPAWAFKAAVRRTFGF